MDTPRHWPQGIGVVNNKQAVVEVPIPKQVPASGGGMSSSERKARPQKDQALNCPRCNSSNTKFCYYNNYSLSQPRYFCKTCRRYWTEGGSLRNVPVGGGSRKNKRSSCSAKKLPDLNPKIHQGGGQDLNLACPPPPQPPPPPDHHDYNNSISKFMEVPFSTEDKTHHHDHQLSMEFLKTGIPSSRTSLCSLMPMTSAGSDSCAPAMYSGGFPNLQDLKPPPAGGLSFSLEGFANGYGGISGIHEGSSGGRGSGDDGGARLLFPTEDLKQADHYEQNRSHADSTGFWNGMLGGGSW